jgi:hypothetical protein
MTGIPDDFVFQLTKEEFDNLKSQIATSSSDWGGRQKLPLVFRPICPLIIRAVSF